jgi:hypothetical protein
MKARIRVLPNPYASLDADGNPNGAFQHEGVPGAFIGARLVKADPNHREPNVGAMIAGLAKAPLWRFEFDDVDPVELDASPHLLYAIRHGELLPADEATARECGLKFVPVGDALAAAKDKACKAFKAETGKEAACLTTPLAGLPGLKPDAAPEPAQGATGVAILALPAPEGTYPPPDATHAGGAS